MKNFKLHILIVICFTIVKSAAIAQEYAVMGSSPLYRYPRLVTDKLPIDTCRLKITYKFSFYIDTVYKEPYFDRQVLEVGGKISHYYSQFAEYQDSAMWVTKQIHCNEDIGNNKGYNIPNGGMCIYEDIFSDYPSTGQQTVISGIINADYIYTEVLPTFNWVIDSQTEDVLGYVCQKATAHFRGRFWSVWFAPEIPVRVGPWKFNGLPGAILKVVDNQNLFEYLAIGIEQPKSKVMYKYDSRVRKVSRNNLIKLLEKRWQSPIELFATHGVDFFPSQAYDKYTKQFDENKLKNFSFDYFPLLELE